MSKSIAVIETPCDCLECMFMRGCGVTSADKPFTYTKLYNCVLEPEHYDEDGEQYIDYLNDYMAWCNKPDWCPLKKLPEKQSNPNYTRYIEGYNKCLDDIFGGMI